MLFDLMTSDARSIEQNTLNDLDTHQQWQRWSKQKRAHWLDMLGIDDEFLRCELDARITSRHEVSEHVRLENLHFQAVPGQRIPCNFWLPKGDGPFPAVVYLCGHGMPGKACYQNHGQWFAQQGYACLVIDAIQIGESQGIHHGLFYHHCNHWISQGYTPAGVEVQVARRALDYLTTRTDVDATRCGLTGISGGATISLFAAAADERFAAVAPHCIAGTLEQLIGERSLDTHCDCATWVNIHRLGLTDVAALIAPRPLLLGFSALDALCTPEPMRAMAKRLKNVWAVHDKSDDLQTNEDEIPHAYSALICKRILSWFNVHLRGMDAHVDDAAVLPFVSQYKQDYTLNLNATCLSAFESNDPPYQERMVDVDRTFIRLPGRPKLPDTAKEWELERDQRITLLRQRAFPNTPRAQDCRVHSSTALSGERIRLIGFKAADGLMLDMHVAAPLQAYANKQRAPFLAGLCDPRNFRTRFTGALGAGLEDASLGTATVNVRGTVIHSIGDNFEWFARRAYALLGQSLPQLQCMELMQAVHLLQQDKQVGNIALYGKGVTSSQAVYAAILNEAVSELVLEASDTTHWSAGPEYPAVLQVGDLPANLALFFPRPITFIGTIPLAFDWVYRLYECYGKADAIRVIPAASTWTPFKPTT